MARDNDKWALMAGLGAAMTGGSAWYDRRQQEKAKALREERLEALKREDLKLAREKMMFDREDSAERNRLTQLQIDSTAQSRRDTESGIQSRFDTEQAGKARTAFDADLAGFREKYLGSGTDANAKQINNIWDSAVDAIFEPGADMEEELAKAEALISQFRDPKTGETAVSAEEVVEGMKYLRARAEFHGINEDTMPRDQLKRMMLHGIKHDDPDAMVPNPIDDPVKTESDGALVDALTTGEEEVGKSSLMGGLVRDTMGALGQSRPKPKTKKEEALIKDFTERGQTKAPAPSGADWTDPEVVKTFVEQQTPEALKQMLPNLPPEMQDVIFELYPQLKGLMTQ